MWVYEGLFVVVDECADAGDSDGGSTGSELCAGCLVGVVDVDRVVSGLVDFGDGVAGFEGDVGAADGVLNEPCGCVSLNGSPGCSEVVVSAEVCGAGGAGCDRDVFPLAGGGVVDEGVSTCGGADDVDVGEVFEVGGSAAARDECVDLCL